MVGVLEVRVQKVRLSWKVDFGSKSDFDRLVIYDAQQNLNSQRNFPAVRQLDPLHDIQSQIPHSIAYISKKNL